MVQSVQNIVEKGDRARNPSSCAIVCDVYNRIETLYFVEPSDTASQEGLNDPVGRLCMAEKLAY
jgi:hypothetical protein